MRRKTWKTWIEVFAKQSFCPSLSKEQKRIEEENRRRAEEPTASQSVTHMEKGINKIGKLQMQNKKATNAKQMQRMLLCCGARNAVATVTQVMLSLVRWEKKVNEQVKSLAALAGNESITSVAWSNFIFQHSHSAGALNGLDMTKYFQLVDCYRLFSRSQSNCHHCLWRARVTLTKEKTAHFAKGFTWPIWTCEKTWEVCVSAYVNKERA